MGKSLKIEPRTDRFIQEYDRLEKEDKMPGHAELAKIIGVNTIRTITEILGRRQNIQPESWLKFKSHFGIPEIQKNTDFSTTGPTWQEYVRAIQAQLEEKDARINDLKEEKEARIRSLEKEKDNYLRLLESNLIGIGEKQLDIEAQLRGAIRREAERFVRDDQKLTKKELDTISRYAANARGLGQPKDIPAHGDRG